MKTERKVTIEREPTEDPAVSAFLSAAVEMPIYSGAALARGLDGNWRHRTSRLFSQAAMRVAEAGAGAPTGEDEEDR
jgi:hypothetical protein